MKKIVLFVSILMFMFTSCSKFLEEASQDMIIPKTIEDLSALFHQEGYLLNVSRDAFLEFMTDDMQVHSAVEQASYSGKPLTEYAGEAAHLADIRYPFSWADDMSEGIGKLAGINAWQKYYKYINGCNIALDMNESVEGSMRDKRYIIAQALALRGYCYHKLVNIYALPYNYSKSSPTENLGVPLILRMHATDELPTRNTVQQVYDQILEDLLKSKEIFEQEKYNLIATHTININSVYAILSRVYLYMENHDKAIEYASKIIDTPGTPYKLLDIGSRMISATSWATTTSGVYNLSSSNEVIWNYGTAFNNSLFQKNGGFAIKYYSSTISDDLMSTYDFRVKRDKYGNYPNPSATPGECFGDLRPLYFFDNNPKFYIDVAKNMTGRPWYVVKNYGAKNDTQYGGQGIRVAEIHLNRAEAYLKKYIVTGNAEFRDKALADINLVRFNRYDKRNVAYQNIEEVTPALLADKEALVAEYWAERRRELVGEESHRWFDLRRMGMPRLVHKFFNQDGTEETFILEQGANGYTVQIPKSTIDLNMNLVQNPAMGNV